MDPASTSFQGIITVIAMYLALVSGPAGGEAQDARTQQTEALSWDARTTQIVDHQGTTQLWGTCGECAIATTLNLVTGSSFTEADIVDYATGRGLCDSSTGGMTLDDMASAYAGLLPPGEIDVHGWGGDYAPTPDEMADKLDRGIILNVSVYGEMMREGKHTGEGELFGTHWIVVHEAVRTEDGSLMGFRIIDSASSITYLAAKELANVYYGHDGTTVTDPCCIEIFRTS